MNTYIIWMNGNVQGRYIFRRWEVLLLWATAEKLVPPKWQLFVVATVAPVGVSVFQNLVWRYSNILARETKKYLHCLVGCMVTHVVETKSFSYSDTKWYQIISLHTLFPRMLLLFVKQEIIDYVHESNSTLVIWVMCKGPVCFRSILCSTVL